MASPPNTDQIIDTALMAHAALERELETETLTARLDRLFELECLQRILNRRYEELPNLLPPERIRPFYEAQTALFATPEEFHIGLIFVPHGRDSFETQKRLEKRVADLRAGASFEDAARELSTGPKASEGGDLGWMGAKDYYRLGPSVSNVVSTLKVGDISEPIYCTDRVLTRDPMMLRGGFAILRIHDHKPAVERSFEEAIDQVRAAYLAQNRTELEREIRDKILARANFQIKHLPDPTEFLP